MWELQTSFFGSQQSDTKTNRYLLRRTSEQSFRRCSSEGGLPCNAQLHLESAESSLGPREQTQPVIEYACRFTGSSQRSVFCLHIAHTHWQLRPHYSQTSLPQPWQEITDCFFQPIFHFLQSFFFLFFFYPLRGDGKEVHSQVSQDILVGLVGPATHPDQEILWDQQNPYGPCPLSFLQSLWCLCHLSLLSEKVGGRTENLRLQEKKMWNWGLFYSIWQIHDIF